MNNPKGVRNRNIQLKFYVNEKELKKIKKRMKLFGTENFGVFARRMCIDGFIFRIDDKKLTEQMIIEAEACNHIREIARNSKYIYGINQEDIKEAMRLIKVMTKSYADCYYYYTNTKDKIFHICDEEEEVSDDEI